MSFDRLARHYSWMETLLAGGRLRRTRLTWLERLAGAERLLIAGVGPGHFLRACAQRFPALEIVSVDASASMLAHAQRQVAGVAPAARLEFVHAALPAWTPEPESFDAVATHFFLDCFAPEELAAVIGALGRGARRCATWLVTDFAIPERGWRRYRARAVHALMYTFFRSVTGIHARRITPPDPILQQHGFALAARACFERGLLQADCWRRG